VDGHLASASVELGVGEGGDVGVSEVVEPDCAEGGDQVVGDVVAVAREGGGLEGELLVLEPGCEVLGDGLVGVALKPAVSPSIIRRRAVRAASAVG